jgi:hypothetical protein
MPTVNDACTTPRFGHQPTLIDVLAVVFDFFHIDTMNRQARAGLNDALTVPSAAIQNDRQRLEAPHGWRLGAEGVKAFRGQVRFRRRSCRSNRVPGSSKVTRGGHGSGATPSQKSPPPLRTGGRASEATARGNCVTDKAEAKMTLMPKK